MLPRDNWCDDDNMCFYVLLQLDKCAIECVWTIWSRTNFYLMVFRQLRIPVMAKIFVSYCRNISYHVNFWAGPETENNEIYAHACLWCVCNRLKMCRHCIYFRMMQTAVFIIIMPKPWLLEKRVGLFNESQQTKCYWMYMDHLVTHQFLFNGVLTIVDTSYGKNI